MHYNKVYLDEAQLKASQTRFISSNSRTYFLRGISADVAEIFVDENLARKISISRKRTIKSFILNLDKKLSSNMISKKALLYTHITAFADEKGSAILKLSMTVAISLTQIFRLLCI